MPSDTNDRFEEAIAEAKRIVNSAAPGGNAAGDGQLDPLDGPHRRTYARLCDARDSAQSAHYALEEGEYRSALIYIAEAETALSEARKMIEPEMRPIGGDMPRIPARPRSQSET